MAAVTSPNPPPTNAFDARHALRRKFRLITAAWTAARVRVRSSVNCALHLRSTWRRYWLPPFLAGTEASKLPFDLLDLLVRAALKVDQSIARRFQAPKQLVKLKV